MEHETHPPSPDSETPVTFRRRGYILIASIAAILVLLMIILVPQLTSQSNAAGNTPAAASNPVLTKITPEASSSPPESTEPAEPSASVPVSAAAVPPSAPVISAPEATQQVPDTVVVPAAAAPTRLTVEAAGIDVAVLPLSPTGADLASQSIVPPFTDDGYWLTSYGAPGDGSTNTTYITGHSWEGREAPFDRFSTHTEAGDIITVTTTETGTLDYVVDSITTHDKDSLKSSDIWNIVPNRLIIISCYTEDPWGKNVVVTASPANS